MKREIKFRAKSYEKWVYGYLVKDSDDFFYISNGNDLSHIDGLEYRFDGVLFDKKTLGQFTGLKDKKGNDIYEGDIISYNDTDIIIEWDNSKCGFNIVEYGMHLFEIVGNIHNNKL